MIYVTFLQTTTWKCIPLGHMRVHCYVFYIQLFKVISVINTLFNIDRNVLVVHELWILKTKNEKKVTNLCCYYLPVVNY